MKRMRINYGEKLALLLECCRELEPWSQTHASGAGMHLVLGFYNATSEEKVHCELLNKQILSTRLSNYFIGKNKKSGLVLGFANSTHEEIRNGTTAIKKILESL